MRKLKIFFITLVCLLASNIAFTLGVGDIEVKSALSEPLNAEIKLFSVRPGEGDNIRVTLATLKEFDKAGIDRPLGLSFLKFKVVEKGDGNAYIHVYSERPIREPFLDFLVDIDWPSGRLLREYTLLLDPPIFAQRKAAPVQAPVVAEPTRIVRQAEPAVTVISTPLSVPTAPVVSNNENGLFPQIQIDAEPTALDTTPNTVVEVSAFSDDSYKVKKNDTLWSIAQSVKPNDSIGVSQMMLALKEANPNAFSNNNINGLKSGFVLRIPELEAIDAIDRGDAVRIAQEENELWSATQDQLSSSVTPSGTSTPAADTKQVPVSSTQEKASVKLVTPDENASGAQGGGEDSAAAAAKLALINEQLASKSKENGELQERLKSLEDQIGSMERLLELKEDSLSELQNKLTTEKPKPVETTPVVEATSEPVVEKTPEPVVKPIVEDKDKINPYALNEIPKSVVTPKPAPKPTPAPAPKPAESSLFDDPIILAAIVAVLLAIFTLIWLVMKRRRENMQFPESILSSKPATVSATQSNDETALLSDFAPSAMDGAIESDSSEVDPSAEADVYIAYGKHQQAEELLATSIEQEPDRLDLRLKLMEVYHATGNADGFLAQASQLNASMDDQNTALWDKAVVMGRELCPGNELFGSDDATAGEDDFADLQGIADLDDDLDLDLEMTDTLAIDESNDEAPATTDDDELSLDIDLEELDTTSSDDDDLSLDIDMGELSLEIEEDTEETAAEPESAEESEAVVDFGELEIDETDLSTEETSIDLGDELELDVEETLETTDADDDAMLGMDEVATKLDLAKAYIDMGDPDGARAILDEVLSEGNDEQQSEAKGLIDQL